MNNLISLAIAIIWIVSGILTFGMSFGFFQQEFPAISEKNYRVDTKFALITGLFGPIGLFVVSTRAVKFENRRLKLKHPMKFR